MVEPRVAIDLEFETHGFVDPTGTVHVGVPTIQDVDARGTWRSGRPMRPGELDSREQQALSSRCHDLGQALHHAGYFGPFGVDAYRWRDADGTVRLQTLSELNARYTMGWTAPPDDPGA